MIFFGCFLYEINVVIFCFKFLKKNFLVMFLNLEGYRNLKPFLQKCHFLRIIAVLSPDTKKLN